MNTGIYKIENIISKKYYIGSAVDFSKRWKKHRNDLRKNVHVNKHLQFSWNKYGEEAFNFSVLEEIENKSFLLSREQYYFDLLKPEYNVCPAAGSSLGCHWSLSDETKKKLSDINRGRVFSEEHKLKLSVAHKGKRFSAIHRQNISATHRKSRKPLSEEHRRKISLSKIGKSNPNAIAAMNAARWAKEI